MSDVHERPARVVLVSLHEQPARVVLVGLHEQRTRVGDLEENDGWLSRYIKSSTAARDTKT